MASWRAPGSILEVPGLDFGGSWVDFSEIFGKKNHKRQKPANKGHRSQICRTAKGGWAAVIPPRGVSIRRPPKVCEACWTTITIACQIRQDQSTKGESKRPSSLCRPRFLFPYLFLSPGGWGPPESTTKFARSASCWVSWADFLLF